MQVLRQTTEYDALQWSAAVKQYYSEERSLIAAAAQHATRASAERAGIGQWLSGLVLREGKVSCPSVVCPVSLLASMHACIHQEYLQLTDISMSVWCISCTGSPINVVCPHPPV